jgi:hypothetical protein
MAAVPYRLPRSAYATAGVRNGFHNGPSKNAGMVFFGTLSSLSSRPHPHPHHPIDGEGCLWCPRPRPTDVPTSDVRACAILHKYGSD